MALELQQVRSKLMKAKREAYRLEKALAKGNGRAEAQALDGSTAPPFALSGPLSGDRVGGEHSRIDGGEKARPFSLKTSNGSSGGKAERKRAAPTGGRAAPSGSVPLTTSGPGSRPGRQLDAMSRCFSRGM